MVRGVRQATGRAPRFGGVPGSTDGTILRMTLGIPIVTCGPGHRLIPHQVDEHVEVGELVDAAQDLRGLGSELPQAVSGPAPRLRNVEAFPVEQDGERYLALRDPAGYTPAVVLVPLGLLEIARAVRRRARRGRHPGRGLPAARASPYAASTSRASSPPSTSRASWTARRFARAAARGRPTRSSTRPRRPASHAGGAYPDDPVELRAMMDGFFAPPAGPGTGARRSGAAAVGGLIAPHIDFHRGGPAYAWAYRDLAERGDADLFVIFGTCHAGMAASLRADPQGLRHPAGPGPGRSRLRRRAGRRGPARTASARSWRTATSTRSSSRPSSCNISTRAAARSAIVPVLTSFVHEALARGQGPEDDPAGARASSTRSRETAAASGRRVAFIAGRRPRPRGPALRRPGADLAGRAVA